MMERERANLCENAKEQIELRLSEVLRENESLVVEIDNRRSDVDGERIQEVMALKSEIAHLKEGLEKCEGERLELREKYLQVRHCCLQLMIEALTL